MRLILEQNPVMDEFSNEILILISSPLLIKKNDNQLLPLQPISIRNEKNIIEESFRQFTDRRFQINFEVATLENIRQIFSRRICPLIIHFIGHGIQEGEKSALIVEDNCGLAYSLTENTLGSIMNPLLRQGKPPCQLAILNACYSEGLSEVLINAGVPHIISIKFGCSILDKAALLFTENFYPPLLRGEDIQSCFESARDAIIQELALLISFDTKDTDSSFQEALKFRLLPENSLEHQNSLALPEEAGDVTVLAPETTNLYSDLYSEKFPFLGRQHEIFSIVSHFEEQIDIPCLGVHGIGGIGKTALVEAVAQWYLERNKWPEGVWIIHLRNNANPDYIVDFLDNLFSYKNHSLDELVRMIKFRKMFLILDDIDTLIESDPYRTVHILQKLSAGNIRIILTSRRLLPGIFYYKSLNLLEIGRIDSRTLFSIFSFIEQKEIDNNISDFEKLLDFLDGYPFAIRLAATYLKQTQCGITELLARLQTNTDDALSFPNLPKERDTSLFKTLKISYIALPNGAKFIFPLVSMFPGGISDEFAIFVFDHNSIFSLESLFQFSMIEIRKKCNRRFYLPEPARAFGENLLKFGNYTNIDYYKNRAIAYYLDSITKITDTSNKTLTVEERKNKISYLLEEESTLTSILNWGYDNEEITNRISKSSRITLLIEQFKFDIKWISIETENNINKSLNAAIRCADMGTVIDLKFLLADIQEKEGRSDYALNTLFEAETLSQEQKLLLKYVKCKKKQGEICDKIGQKRIAIKHYESADKVFNDLKGIDIYEDSKLWQDHSMISYKIAIIYFELALYTEAQKYFNQTITISRKSIDDSYVFDSNEHLAKIYIGFYKERNQLKKFTEAYKFLDKTLEIYLRLNQNNKVIEVLGLMAKMAKNKVVKMQALSSLTKIENIIKGIGTFQKSDSKNNKIMRFKRKLQQISQKILADVDEGR